MTATAAALAKIAEPQRMVIRAFPGPAHGDRPTESLVQYGPDGAVQKMLHKVQLREDLGHIDVIDKHPRISALGYRRLNQYLGISFQTPDAVVGESGELVPNPYFCRAENGELLYVRVRLIGVGYNTVGRRVAKDLTFTFDLRSYFARDLKKKWQWRAGETPKEWGRLINARQLSANVLNEPNRQVVPLPNGFALVVDLTHVDVISVVMAQVDRANFADRLAFTMCERNIMKWFCPVTTPPQDGVVQVVSWCAADWTPPVESIGLAEAGHLMIEGEAIPVDRESQRVDDPDEVSAAAEAAELPPEPEQPDEPAAPGIDPTPAKPIGPELDAVAELATLRTRVRAAVAKLPPEEQSHLLGAWECASTDELIATEDKARLREILRSTQPKQKTTTQQVKKTTEAFMR